ANENAPVVDIKLENDGRNSDVPYGPSEQDFEEVSERTRGAENASRARESAEANDGARHGNKNASQDEMELDDNENVNGQFVCRRTMSAPNSSAPVGVARITALERENRSQKDTIRAMQIAIADLQHQLGFGYGGLAFRRRTNVLPTNAIRDEQNRSNQAIRQVDNVAAVTVADSPPPAVEMRAAPAADPPPAPFPRLQMSPVATVWSESSYALPPIGTMRDVGWPENDGLDNGLESGTNDSLERFRKDFNAKPYETGSNYFDWMRAVVVACLAASQSGKINTARVENAVLPRLPAQIQTTLQGHQPAPLGPYSITGLHNWPIQNLQDLFAFAANLIVNKSMTDNALCLFHDMKWHYFINANGSATSATINDIITTLRNNFVRVEAYARRESKTRDERAAQMAQREALLHVIGNTNTTQLAGVCNQENALASFNALSARARVMDLKPLNDTPRPLLPVSVTVVDGVLITPPVLTPVTLQPPALNNMQNGNGGHSDNQNNGNQGDDHPGGGPIHGRGSYRGRGGYQPQSGFYGRGGYRGGYRGGSRRDYDNENPGEFVIKCFNCGGKNHLAETCSSPPSNSQLKYLAKKATRGLRGNGGHGSSNNAAA
ncbi:hypothetical protein HDU93_007697, partial [Gonapodya sp. JEL0774]